MRRFAIVVLEAETSALEVSDGVKRHGGRLFHFAGRRARCKKCHASITVPPPEEQLVLIETAPPGPRLPPRTRRLRADAEQMRFAFEHFPLIKVRPAALPAPAFEIGHVPIQGRGQDLGAQLQHMHHAI